MSENHRGNNREFNNRQWRGDGERRREFGNRGRRFDDDRNSGSDNRSNRRFDRDDRRGNRFDREDRGGRDFGNRGRNFDRDDRGGRRFERDDRRGGRRFDREDRGDRDFGNRGRNFDRNDRGGRRFDRDDRRGNRFDREDRGGRDFGNRGRNFDRDDRGGRRFERDDRRGGKRFERDDRRGGKRFDRDDRRGGRGFNRDDRGGKRFDRDDRRGRRFERDERGGKRFDRDDRRDRRFENENEQRFDAHDQFDKEFAEKSNMVEGLPIPEGLEGSELDPQVYEYLGTLGERGQEDVAKLLVMAGQLIDLDPEEAYKYAQAAVKRAGRVDVVREAAALTAYATGRYQEALREVRAVRRMRDDYSLRAVEADCERGLGKPEKALELIDETDLSKVDLSEQVELVLVAAGARADMGETQTALVLVDDALAKLGADADEELIRRLMSAKVDHLRALDRNEEADEVEAQIPAEEEDNDIFDVKMMADSDIDDVRSDLKGSDEPLAERYDTLVLDLDGVCYMGKNPVPHAAEEVTKAVSGGMKHVFVTNNSSRTPQAVADQLKKLGFPAEPENIMTSAMDALGMMKEELEEGAKVYVIGGQGLRNAVEGAGFKLVDSADDEPDAVVQGFDRSVDWAMMSEGALAINAGAKFFATNLDASLPIERGFGLGNGALVRAVRHATNTKPKAAGKPLPGIFLRGIEMIGGNHAISVGDRLDTDIAGGLAASIPSLHVLTGVSDAKAIILADRGMRPQLVHRDMRGLNEPHPRPRHHKDGTWTCGVGQVAKVVGNRLTLDGVQLPEDEATVTLDSYRALIAAAWHFAGESGPKVICPIIKVVDNDDPAGIITAPEVVEEPSEVPSADSGDEVAAETAEDLKPSEEAEEYPMGDLSDEELENVNVEGIPEFLPGEEELEELLEETKHLEDEE